MKKQGAGGGVKVSGENARKAKTKKYRNPALTADIIIENKQGEVVLIRRKFPPFQGQWALPGGFVEYGETVEGAAVREAMEETSLRVKLKKLVGVYSDPRRDPRGHTVAVAFAATARRGKIEARDDAGEAAWFKKIPFNSLAFDHKKILTDYLRSKKKRLPR